MNGTGPLSDFAARVLALRGAAVEHGPGGSLEALLPPDLARAFGNEYLRLRFDPTGGEDGGELVAFGSATLETLGALLGEDGRFGVRRVAVPYIKKSGLEEAVRRSLSFPTARALYREAGDMQVPYFAFNFRYAASSDEKRDGLASVSVNGLTGAVVPDIEGGGGYGAPETVEATTASPPDARAVERAYAKACALARDLAEKQLADFLKGMERRLARDLARVNEYYDAIRKAARRRHSAPERARAKLQAAEVERELKKKDLAAKYATRVEMALVSTRLLLVPAMATKWLLVRGRREREIWIVWNPVLKLIEPVECGACGQDTSAPGLCENGHLACPECAAQCPKCNRGTEAPKPSGGADASG